MGSARVLMLQAVWSCKSCATASMLLGSIKGSSPWTFTTIASSGKPSKVAASAKRSLPLRWSARVMTAFTPNCWQTCITSALSVATTTWPAWDSWARWATLTTIGMPAKSAKGLLGNRLADSRAGISTTKDGALNQSPSSASLKGRASISSITGMPSRMG